MLMAAFTSALQAKLQAVHRKRAWLSRDFASTCPHALQRCEVKCGLIFSTRPGALSSSRRTRPAHPLAMISRLRPAFWRTFRPGCRERAPRRARHVADLEIFDADHVESPRKVRAQLLGPVLASVALAGFEPRDRGPDTLALARAAPRAGQPALQPGQAGTLGRMQAGAVQQFAGRQSCADGHPPVDADHDAGTGPRDGFGDGGERDMPASGPVAGDPVGPGRRDSPGPAESHPAGLGNPDLASLTGQAANVARALTATMRNPSSRPALRQLGLPWVPAK